eukprot:TRINITY_DN6185_c0_g2_i1.p2 TRINITY_DN6185_c0_g2~~TRINITY_DN6185_c0_g2_i1.p2  ORF type:complete len:160 (-),score=26.95 TRINITY_DN6185_c0_g2_i1:708-1187(-)
MADPSLTLAQLKDILRSRVPEDRRLETEKKLDQNEEILAIARIIDLTQETNVKILLDKYVNKIGSTVATTLTPNTEDTHRGKESDKKGKGKRNAEELSQSGLGVLPPVSGSALHGSLPQGLFGMNSNDPRISGRQSHSDTAQACSVGRYPRDTKQDQKT